MYIKYTTTTTTTTTTIISEGADPLRPVVGSPYSRSVITGKPGIILAASSFGFSRSPLPALCRQDTSCAWCSRLRRMHDGMSGKNMDGGMDAWMDE